MALFVQWFIATKLDNCYCRELKPSRKRSETEDTWLLLHFARITLLCTTLSRNYKSCSKNKLNSYTARSISIWTLTQFWYVCVCTPMQWIWNKAIKVWLKSMNSRCWVKKYSLHLHWHRFERHIVPRVPTNSCQIQMQHLELTPELLSP